MPAIDHKSAFISFLKTLSITIKDLDEKAFFATCQDQKAGIPPTDVLTVFYDEYGLVNFEILWQNQRFDNDKYSKAIALCNALNEHTGWVKFSLIKEHLLDVAVLADINGLDVKFSYLTVCLTALQNVAHAFNDHLPEFQKILNSGYWSV